MEAQGISQGRTSSWGAPASRSAPKYDQTHNGNRQIPFRGGQSCHYNQSPATHNYQRPSPYNKDHQRGRGANMSNSFHNGRQQNDNSGFQSPGQNFSPQNPFVSQGHSFSNDNPFQSKGQSFSPNNPFQRDSPNNGQNFQRNQFQSSPLSQTPGMTDRSFSPRTPSTNFCTPSPRPNSNFRGHSNSSQRHFQRRNTSMGNPGGSSNIQDYISSSVLEDPWKNLPPKAHIIQ